MVKNSRVLEVQFDEAEGEATPYYKKLQICVRLERLPPGAVYGCNGYISTRETKDDYVSAVCLYKKE
ncbi:unnamed protein product [Haemonchus placei]|uniref:DUF4313 domain-containing protein n=1 Tax=Haemonchus placei TaxID=6290 RepID=A0A0N4WH33_HAEPC|nr:unnamed protein product [Haemonchus placei]